MVSSINPAPACLTIMPRQPSSFVVCRHCHQEFLAITVCHLRRIHDYDGEHPIEDYKRTFRLKFASCAESRRKIGAAKDAYWARTGQHWTDRKLLSEIHRRHRSGQSLRGKNVPDRIYLAGRRLFGTWRAAVERAGLNYEEVTGIFRWTRTKIVKAIRELAARNVPLSATYVRAHHGTLFNAAVKAFARSWGKALRAAGFDPDEHKVPRSGWNRQRAEDWVRKQSARGRSLLARAAPRDLKGFIYRRLHTTWPEFVESLGVPYPGIRKRYDWTKETLLEEIRRWKADRNKLNYKSVQSAYQALIHQARKFFGSWDRARAAADV
jgi:hypothetical protein